MPGTKSISILRGRKCNMPSLSSSPQASAGMAFAAITVNFRGHGAYRRRRIPSSVAIPPNSSIMLPGSGTG